jgi:hypothetical protein
MAKDFVWMDLLDAPRLADRQATVRARLKQDLPLTPAEQERLPREVDDAFPAGQAERPAVWARLLALGLSPEQPVVRGRPDAGAFTQPAFFLAQTAAELAPFLAAGADLAARDNQGHTFREHIARSPGVYSVDLNPGLAVVLASGRSF